MNHAIGQRVRSLCLKWTSCSYVLVRQEENLIMPTRRFGSIHQQGDSSCRRGNIPYFHKRTFASNSISKPPDKEVIESEPAFRDLAKREEELKNLVKHKLAPSDVEVGTDADSDVVKFDPEVVDIEKTKPKLKDVAASQPEYKAVYPSKSQMRDIIVNKEELKDLYQNKPELKDIAQIKPDAKFVVRSEPEMKEVVTKQPEHHDITSKLPEPKEILSSASLTKTQGEHSTMGIATEPTKTRGVEPFSNTSVSKLLHNICKQSLNLDEIKPMPPSKSCNLAAYINDSATLTNLVKLGMDLSKAEKVDTLADRLVKMDFERDVKPFLMFLHEMGVEDENLGVCLSKNPGMFLEDLEDLYVRVQYLKSKNFPKEAIGKIVTKVPQILSLSTKDLDTQLGFLQQHFHLSGEEVRNLVTTRPSVTLWNRKIMKYNKMALKEFMGFNDELLKALLFGCPKIYVTGRGSLLERFDYVHNQMAIPHKRFLEFPGILRQRVFIIKQRHKFLAHLGKDQFDPTEPNYISLRSLVEGNNAKFCEAVARVPLEQFNDFLKTL